MRVARAGDHEVEMKALVVHRRHRLAALHLHALPRRSHVQVEVAKGQLAGAGPSTRRVSWAARSKGSKRSKGSDGSEVIDGHGEVMGCRSMAQR
jgi:hypothetical protein